MNVSMFLPVARTVVLSGSACLYVTLLGKMSRLPKRVKPPGRRLSWLERGVNRSCLYFLYHNILIVSSKVFSW